LGILVVYRIGSQIPTPGIDAKAMSEFFGQLSGTLFGLYNMFVGGAFEKASVFSLGIMPYISASIIIQLLGAVIPFFQRLQKEGEEGRRKITQYTRYGTVLIAALQALGTSVYLESLNAQGVMVVPNPGMGFKLLTMLTFTCGTIFIMWLGEKITEKGIGNGISLIIFIGIIASFPTAVYDEIRLLLSGQRNFFTEIFLVAFMIAVIAAIVLVTRAQRRIPVQYAKRVVGRKVYGGQATHIPLSVNTAGVIPIIFAQSIMFAPSTLTSFFPNSEFMQNIASLFNPGAFLYSLVFGLYDGDRQIGLARVISDYAIFAYLCDVFIHEDYRSRGLGKWLMATVMSHSNLQGLRRWTLATTDAHGLYRQFGWAALDHPERWMEILNPYPGEERA